MWNDIRNTPDGITALPMGTCDDLWKLSPRNWDRIRAGFSHNFRVYDKLLHKIHYLRGRPLESQNRRILREFLTIGYVISDDIRYFNEYLWFREGQSDEWEHLNVHHFNRNTKILHHCFPLASREDVASAINDRVHFHGRSNTQPQPFKIGALGHPFLFGRFYREITRQGYPVELLFFPDLVRRGRLCSLLGQLHGFLTRRRSRIVQIRGTRESGQVAESIAARQIALAVHRLHFIIRDNIYGQIEYGLLNDHWGPLPFVRGRSTPEYSLLFGFPLVSTVHLIDGGVDTGPIVKYFEIELGPHRTARQLKRHMSRTKQHRYADATKLLAEPLSRGLIPSYITNDHHKGLQYYSMHPVLRDYVEKYSLTSYAKPKEH